MGGSLPPPAARRPGQRPISNAGTHINLAVVELLQVATDSRLRFFGNVRLGQDISAAELSSLYDIVVLAYGAAGDRTLRVPGAGLNGVFSARDFVNW